MRKRLLIPVATFALAVGYALPASAADTTTTFVVGGGALTIGAPASQGLGSGASGGIITDQLGTVTVSDLRSLLTGGWTASVAATDFQTGGKTAAETIGKASVDYWSGLATATSGTAVRTPGQAGAVNKQDLGTGRTAFSATGVVGNNSTSWNPTLIVNVPAAAVAGTYTGIVTHSVA